ncbi:MAG: MBL fold metallo-hydrolase, partial [Chloroflexota bacterium]
LVLPGHRRIFSDLKARVDELKCHHKARADEAMSILQQGSKNAYQVAAQMTWDISYRNWDEIAVFQRMFATGEALAHLKYLEAEGKIIQENGERETVFSLK